MGPALPVGKGDPWESGCHAADAQRVEECGVLASPSTHADCQASYSFLMKHLSQASHYKGTHIRHRSFLSGRGGFFALPLSVRLTGPLQPGILIPCG